MHPRKLRRWREDERRGIEQAEGKLLAKLADQAIADCARVVGRRTGIARRVDDSGRTAVCGKRETAVLMHDSGCHRVSDEGEQHESHDALYKRMRAGRC